MTLKSASYCEKSLCTAWSQKSSVLAISSTLLVWGLLYSQRRNPGTACTATIANTNRENNENYESDDPNFVTEVKQTRRIPLQKIILPKDIERQQRGSTFRGRIIHFLHFVLTSAGEDVQHNWQKWEAKSTKRIGTSLTTHNREILFLSQ